jgi:hypothetical protein
VDRKTALKNLAEHPEVEAYCQGNFALIACPDECPHYTLCKSWDYTDKSGTFPLYPCTANQYK